MPTFNLAPSGNSVRATQMAFSKVRKCLPKNSWVGHLNYYKSDTYRKTFTRAGTLNPKKNNQLAEYIAASGPLHCGDGWHCLGRSISNLLTGDAGNCTHLAYYAELRAAMSLLAMSGMGIFGDRHFLLDLQTVASRKKILISNNSGIPTHKAAWFGLEAWAKSSVATDLLQKIIRPFGLPLGQWLSSVSGSASSPLSYLGADLLQQWGLDIRRFSDEDGVARNEASYRPTRMNEKQQPNPEFVIDFLESLWTLAEPSSGAFINLDRFLLRTILENYRKSLGLKKKQYETLIKNTLNSLGLGGRIDIEEFLLRIQVPDDPLLLVEANAQDDIGHPKHHIQVLARAFLLLRIATGVCENLFHEVSVAGSDIQFWWEKLGTEVGIWPVGGVPASMNDLWLDVEDALSTMSSERANIDCYAKFKDICPRDTIILSGAERIIFWGLRL